MNDTHFLNESLRRLEPNETLCQFCKNVQIEDPAHTYYCPVYKEMDRTNLVVYRSVKFNKIDVGIPRCKACHSIHSSSKTKGWIISIIITIVLGVLFFLSSGIYVIFYLVFGPAILLVFGPKILEDFITEQTAISTKKDAAEKDPLIASMLQGGWRLTKPNA